MDCTKTWVTPTSSTALDFLRSAPWSTLTLCLLGLMFLAKRAYALVANFYVVEYILAKHHPLATDAHLPVKDTFLPILLVFVGQVENDDVSLFCKNRHEQPVQLPCGHLCCFFCVWTLIDCDYNNCGLCNRQYFSFDDVEATNEASAAKKDFFTILKSFVISTVGVCVILCLWPWSLPSKLLE